jgi:transcriptional regulator with XRE-family HTH domain
VNEMRTLRLVRGWSQEDFAALMGWSQSKAARYEAGEPVRLTDDDLVRLHRLRVLAEQVSA